MSNATIDTHKLSAAEVEEFRYRLKSIFDAMIERGCPVKSEEMHASIDLLCNAALRGLSVIETGKE